METRVDKVERLKIVESNIKSLKEYKRAIGSRYFEDGLMSLELRTNDYQYDKEETNGTCIEFNNKLMKEFIEAQISLFQKESSSILSELIDG